ncbi:hypothetical protein CHS0354_016955 [Potamilus streckersoni]|uniref:Uncharacterized protein n=1 Tax=Potamilus streckersoni TaxID=2493646 RepID=A0AAE0S8L3_9BIVA|nr:hypothetical protein CHS0354_016955 [Potamilus streckersoni]
MKSGLWMVTCHMEASQYFTRDDGYLFAMINTRATLLSPLPAKGWDTALEKCPPKRLMSVKRCDRSP